MKNWRSLTRREVISLGVFTTLSLLGSFEKDALAEEFYEDGEKKRRYKESPSDLSIRLSATKINYADNSSFDSLLEAALKRRDNLVLVKTHSSDIDLPDRLNLWIKAWNEGPEVIIEESYHGVMMDSPAYAPVPGSAYLDIVLVLPELMDRVERYVNNAITWWNNQETRKKRVKLLSPYLLAWKTDEKTGETNLIFYK